MLIRSEGSHPQKPGGAEDFLHYNRLKAKVEIRCDTSQFGMKTCSLEIRSDTNGNPDVLLCHHYRL